jgi:MFS family permease
VATEQAGSERDAGSPSGAEHDFHVTEAYRHYVVWLLFVVYVLNFLDRQILTILIQPIKQEFQFSDTQLGLLGGLAFAFLYSTLGIPIARWADRSSRVNIISIALFVWSLFTAATGLARSFTQLFTARVLVGIGEAGLSPPAYSLLSDYFPPERRARAIAIYSMGINGGVFLGFLLGGTIAQAYGWRAAFYVVGLPGCLLAILVRTTLREPPRGFSEPGGRPKAAQPPPLGEVFRDLWAKRSFPHLALAAALHAFVGYGVGGFVPAFLMRSHGMDVREVGQWLAFISALGGAAGTYLGGYLADRLAVRTGDRRHYLWVPGISTLINVPTAMLVYMLPDKYAVLWLMFPTGAIGAMYLGPTFSTTQSLVGVRERALAGAILLFVINMIGLGLGPMLTGMLSDWFKASLTADGMAEAKATAEGLRYALIVMVCVNLWSAFHYMVGARTLRADLDAATAKAQSLAR